MPKSNLQPVRRALISVSDKSGLVELGQALSQRNIEILSTGGSAKMLMQAGIKVTEVADHTGFPEMMDGRVKTLHPMVHGGLLALRDDEGHLAAMKEHPATGWPYHLTAMVIIVRPSISGSIPRV